MRQAERALFDLRRGLSILMRDHERAFVVCAVEGLVDAAPGEMQALAGSPAHLVLSGHRLAAIGRPGAAEAVAVALAPLPDAAGLRTLAWQRGASLPAGVALRDGGLVERAALRLLGRAQLVPAALVCEVERRSQAAAVAAEVASGNLLAVDAAEVMRLCESGPGRLARISEARVPLAEAENSRFVLFREADGVHEHVAIVIGDPPSWPDDVPVRLHSSCLTGDLFGSLRCDCGEQLRRGVAAIHALGGGVLLYLSQEGRGIGLANKLRAYGLQDEGLDTIDADQVIGFSKDERDFRIAHEMLDELGIARILLLTNNPSKVAALQKAGIHVVGRRAIYGEVTAQNQRYLKTKARRHGHWLQRSAQRAGRARQRRARMPACRGRRAPRLIRGVRLRRCRRVQRDLAGRRPALDERLEVEVARILDDAREAGRELVRDARTERAIRQTRIAAGPRGMEILRHPGEAGLALGAEQPALRRHPHPTDSKRSIASRLTLCGARWSISAVSSAPPWRPWRSSSAGSAPAGTGNGRSGRAPPACDAPRAARARRGPPAPCCHRGC